MNATIIFDFDGVLVDTIEIFSTAVNIAGEQLNQPVDFAPDDLRNIKRMSIPEIVAAAKVDPQLSHQFIAEIEKVLLERVNQIRLFPKMAELVEQLCELGKLGIVSATSRPVLSQVLLNEGIHQHFDAVIGGDTPGTKSEKILTIIQKNGSSASRSCMIGDTVSDIEQGKAAGVITVAVSWGWHAIDWLRTATPNYQANQPEDLFTIVSDFLLNN